ncbi:MAG: polyketide antibiotic transporter [Solirubrobacteraceae bacterium]
MSTSSDAVSLSGTHGRHGKHRTRPTIALARRSFASGRTRTLSFAVLFALVAYIQPVSYRRAYPTLADRLAFARSFADNKAIRLFYGVPHDLLTVGGYTAWRVGGIVAVFAAVWGALAAIAAMRSEEDAGRTELVLALPISRGVASAAALDAIAAGALVLWGALVLGLLLAGLPAGGATVLALAIVSVIPVFVGVGALASQLAQTRRQAIELAMGALALAFVCRVIADTASGAGWLRWLTPLGWVEQLRPFAAPRPVVLALPIVVATALLAIAVWSARRRDVGTGLWSTGDSRAPHLWLLSSTATQTLRGELTSLAAWLGATGAFAFIVGVISHSISSAGLPASLRNELAKLGARSIATPSGYLGFTFLFIVLAVSLFSCSQVAAARTEELQGRVETMFAAPLSRQRWLLERLLVAFGAIVAISLAAGALAWAGATVAGVQVPLEKLLLAATNCMTVATLFLGAGFAGYAVAPRAGAAWAYALVTVAFLWQLFGALLGAPSWLVKLSPFEHVGLVPNAAFKPGAGAVMVLIGVALAVVAVACLRRRDVVVA